ncbi:MAG: hypothetical protein KA422_06060 [Rhizobacter sp.]|nr:hypothetical protein [Rhizobacter sp.]
MRKPTPVRTASRAASTITVLPLADLQLDPKNPRLHSKRQIHQIAARAVPVLATGTAWVQNGPMMNGGMWGGGWGAMAVSGG